MCVCVVNFSIRPHVTIFRRMNGFQLPCMCRVCVFDERSRAKSQVYFISIKTVWFHRLWSSFLHTHIHANKQHNRDNIHDIDVIRFPNGIQEFFSYYFFSFIHSIPFSINICKLWVIDSLLIPVCICTRFTHTRLDKNANDRTNCTCSTMPKNKLCIHKFKW